MPSLVGGPAGKFGNEFERLWLSRLLLEVITDKAASVRIEPYAAPELKTECFVTRPGGVIECHQCKRENGPAGKWTISELESHGIISGAKLFLDQSTQHRYFFISADRVPSLTTFRERAIKFDRLDEFLKEVATNGRDRQEFKSLTALLGIDISIEQDQVKLVDFLRRFIIVSEAFDLQRVRLEELAGCYINGEPSAAVAVLEKLASTTVRRQLDIRDIQSYLANNGFQFRDLTKMENLPLLLDECCNRFERTFRPYLIDGKPVGRPETESLVTAVKDANIRLILLHGRGGSGKSGIIYEALSRLRNEGVTCVTIRLDQDEVGTSALTLAENMGLPAGPLQCLSVVAQKRPAVLFIDQLDAIRWTSQHSASSWDTISQLVETAVVTPNVTVVLACRTHDANDDPRIQSMIETLSRQRVGAIKIDAAPLSLEILDVLLARMSLAAIGMTQKQREILRWPQNLFLWQRINSEVGANSFKNGTDLCRAYWIWVRKQFLPHELDALNEHVLPILIEGSLNVGRELVPTDVRSKYPQTVDKLLSIGTLVDISQNRVRFSHQSYFDFVTAEHLAGQLRSAKIQLEDWVLAHDSLFNRQQLRQLLEILRDDDPRGFVQHAKSILTNSNIRFHLKQVTLEIIASAETPSDVELNLLLECRKNLILSNHVPPLFHRNVAWFDLLHKCGLILQWTQSIDDLERGLARALMNTFIDQRSDVIYAVVQSSSTADRRSLLESILNWRSAGLVNDAMFEEYLGLIRSDSGAMIYIDLKLIADRAPKRAIRLFREIAHRAFRSITHGGKKEARQDRIEGVVRDSSETMRLLVRKHPLFAWRQLSSLLKEVRRLRVRERRRRKKRHYTEYEIRLAAKRLSRLVQELLTTAGMRIARRQPDKAWSHFTPLVVHKCRFHQRVGLTSLCGLDTSYADRLVGLLESRTSLLTCGGARPDARYLAAKMFPARRILRKFGPAATAETLAKVEAVICSYVSKRERQNWRYAHDVFMETSKSFDKSSKLRIYPRTIFASQYVLLDAFPIGRMTSLTRDWLGVLSRKFGPIDVILKEPPTSSGGWIGSSIPEDRALKLSDKSWLKIIQSKAVVTSNTFSRSRRRNLVESTPRMFSGQFQRAAYLSPTRFAAFAMKIPVPASEEYIAAFFRAMGETKPPQNSPPGWAMAPAVLIEPVLKLFEGRFNDREIATAYAWLLNNRPDEDWSDDTLARVVEIAKHHPNPEGVEATTSSGVGEKMHPDYVTTAINCVRGVAACAIASLLSADAGHRAILDSAIKHLENDSHPSVRISATRVAIPLLNIDKAEAIRYCLSVNSYPDDEVLRGDGLSRFLSYTLIAHFNELRSLIQRMISSKNDQVAERGAQWAMLTYLHEGGLNTEVDSCLRGSIPQRVGLGKILAGNLQTGRCDSFALECCAALLNDSDKTVRDSIATAFFHAEFYAWNGSHLVLATFANSPAFGDNLDDVLHGLKESIVSLTLFVDVIKAIVERLSNLTQNSAGGFGISSHYLPDVLLRLYEQAEGDPPTRRLCLDILDKSLQDQLGYDMTKAVDD